MPPIKVFCVGASLIKNHTHKGPKAVSSKKKIPTSGELMNCGAILINTKAVSYTHLTLPTKASV